MRVRLPFLGRVALAAAAILIGLLSTAPPALADPIRLDQRSLPTQVNDTGSTFAQLSGRQDPLQPFRRAQTFTVGLDGRLARIDALLNGDPSDVLLQILDTAAGAPTTRVLASSHSTALTADGWRTFDLADRLVVQAGDVFAIELVNVVNGSFAWLGQEPGPRYARGSDFFSHDPFDTASFTLNPMHDNYFRTFVESASPTPEPNAFVLAFSGLAALALFRTKLQHV